MFSLFLNEDKSTFLRYVLSFYGVVKLIRFSLILSFRISLMKMAHRHLMAVCVVCLLCAEHLPCKEHVLAPSKNIRNIANSLPSSPPSKDVATLTKTADIPGIYLYDKRKDKTKEGDEVAVVRRKRHADHAPAIKHEHEETPEVTKVYIEKLFNQFSNRKTNTMNVDEFEAMMMKLELKNLIAERAAPIENATCMNSLDFLGKITNTEEHPHQEDTEDEHHHHQNHKHHEEEEHHQKEHEDHLTFRNRISIETKHMLEMCPILLYHIINRQSPLESFGCLDGSNFITSEIVVENDSMEMEDRRTVWLYSTLSIILVSLCGLFGVAVIPIMEKHYYHQVLQFLVALAVGTLAGDALLHLLPHAMMPTYEGQDIHHMMMMRGLAAVGGIVFFYFFERFLTMITEWRQRQQKRDKPSSRVRVMRDPESVSLNNGTATCKHKYSSYPYCYDEIALDTKDDHHEHQHLEEGVSNNHNDKLKHNGEDSELVSPTDAKKMNGAILDQLIDSDINTLSTSLDEESMKNALCNNNKNMVIIVPAKKESVPDENYTIILR